MSTSPVGPEDVRAAAEVHRELGPEYSDAVVAAFLEKVDQAVAARVEARLAAAAEARPPVPASHRNTLLKGVAIGACSVIAAGGIALAAHTAYTSSSVPVAHPQPRGIQAHLLPEFKAKPGIVHVRVPGPAPKPTTP